MRFVVIDRDLALGANAILIALDEVQADRALEILAGEVHLEVMIVLTRPNVELRLVLLVGYAKTNLGPKHHLRGVHEVEHDVFKVGNERLLVDFVEEYPVISGHLDADVAFDEVQLAPHLLELVVLLPLATIFVTVVTFLLDVIALLEEKD